MKNQMQSLFFEGKKVISYSTHVATIEGDTLICYGYWSATTRKHLKQLAAQQRLTIIEKSKGENPSIREAEENAKGMLKAVGNNGNIPTAVQVDGKVVVVGLNAYIK